MADYDYIIIDCQPSLGLLTVNALTAAHGVIVPLECEFFALRGVALLTETIEKVRERLNPELELDGILATMYDSRTVHSREVLARVRRGVRRPRLPHRHRPHRALPGDHGGRRADHHVRLQLRRRGRLPAAGQGGARPVPRRVSLPGADELFRTTGGMALQSSSPRQHPNGEAAAQVSERLRPVPTRPGEPDRENRIRPPRADADPAAGRESADAGRRRPTGPRHEARSAQEPQGVGSTPPAAEHAPASGPESQPLTAARAAPPAGAHGQQRRRERRGANRRPSGRERHDEKITVYVSAEELMDLEHARLVLRGEHGLAVDRGRIVREAVAVVLADLESRGDASILVRRLRGR